MDDEEKVSVEELSVDLAPSAENGEARFMAVLKRGDLEVSGWGETEGIAVADARRLHAAISMPLRYCAACGRQGMQVFPLRDAVDVDDGAGVKECSALAVRCLGCDWSAVVCAMQTFFSWPGENLPFPAR